MKSLGKEWELAKHYFQFSYCLMTIRSRFSVWWWI